MNNALNTALAVFVLGLIAYFYAWWDGPGLSWRYTKWFFVIIVLLSLTAGAGAYFFHWFE